MLCEPTKTMKILNSKEEKQNVRFIEEEFRLMPLKLQISDIKSQEKLRQVMIR